MDRNLDDSDLQMNQEGDSEQSLVGKLKKNVTEIISNTPLSKWFRKQNDATPTSTIRRRQDDSEDEDDLQEFQPPTKRTKLPPTKETLSLNVSEVLSPISTVNNVKKSLYKNFPEPMAGPSGYQTRKMLNSTSIMSESTFRSIKLEGSENAFKNPKIMTGSELINKESNNSDSEESTSGYSSGRVGSKEIISQSSSKQTSPLETSPKKNRSLFQGTSSNRLFSSERSLSPNRNSTLSSRMPSFNPSTFGSTSFVDRTLSTKRILNSPFYSGRTIYGGASAYGQRTRRAPNDIHKVLRQSVSIKPTNRSVESGNLQLGKTARRILDTLEQYSSPVSDAKKIPIASKKHKSEGSLAKFVGANPYTLRETRSASSKELQVPSVTDILKAKMDQQKTRLQDSTEAVRQIATKSSAIDNDSYQIPVHRGNEKHTTKMKTKITSVRHKVVVEESVPELKLNPVSLPIKELPKFDISIPPPATSSTVTISKPVPPSQLVPMKKSLPVSEPVPIKESAPAKQEVPTSEPASIFFFEKKVESDGVDNTKLSAPKSTANDKSVTQNDSEFKFSAPLVLAEYLKPLKALNNFKFSEPLVKKRKSIHPELDNQENKIIETNKTKKNNGANVSSETKTTESKVDSIMEKFKSKEGVWECSVCLIRNQPDKSKCVACENPKPKSISAESVQVLGAPISLKPAERTWECPTCMIRNKENVLKCVACEEKKPEKTSSSGVSKVSAFTGLPVASTPKPAGMENLWECKSCSAKNPQQLSQCQRCLKAKSSEASSNVSFSKPSETTAFGSKFALPPDTWECSTCMIRNKIELTKCAACESPKPPPKGQLNQNQSIPVSSNFGAEFKKKEDEWECQVCMIRNKADATKCQCCESANPNPSTSATSATPPKVSTFNFGIDKNTANSFTFGIPSGLQATSNASKTNVALVFGEKREEPKAKVSEAQSFTFGVPPKDSSNVETKKEPSKAIEKVDPPKSIPTFSFGTDSKTSEAGSSKAAPAFSFGATPKATDSTPSKSATDPTFNFGATPKTTNTTPSKSSTNPTFSFGATPKTTETTPSKSSTNSTFSFGASPKTTEATSTTPVPSFSFGAQPKASEATPSKSTPVFSFGSASKSESTSQAKSTPTFTFDTLKKTETVEKKTSMPTFSFGATRKSDATPSLGVTTPTFSFSSTNQTDKEKENSKTGGEMKFNPLLKPTEKLPEKAAVAPVGFSFGLPNVAAPTNTTHTRTETSNETSPRKRSKPADEDTASQAKIPTFSFKSPTTNGDLSKTASPFSKPAQDSTSTAPAGGFSVNFSSGKTNVTTNSATIVPTFGSNVSQADSSKSAAPMFKFGSSSETPKQANGFNFGTSAPSFGTTAPTNATQNKTFTFGSSATTTQARPPSFGATPTKVGGFSFGGSNETKPATFSFNAANSENKTSSQFSFDSNTPKTQPSFAFNQPAAPAFSFGSNQKTTTGFGTGSTATNPFGAADSKQEPMFGSAPNQSAPLNGGTFNFGSSATTNQKAGFSFGGSSSTSGSGGTQSGFSFGSSTVNASAPTASGGFNFSGPAPTFDASAKPAFNFTGGAGIAAFSAPPAQDGTMPQRKIKKAVRRVR